MSVCFAATIGDVRLYGLDAKYMNGLRLVPDGQTIALGNAANPHRFNMKRPSGVTKAILDAADPDNLQGKRVYRSNPDGKTLQYVEPDQKMDTGKAYMQRVPKDTFEENVQGIVHLNGMNLRGSKLTKDQAGKECRALYKDALYQTKEYDAVVLPFTSTWNLSGDIDPNVLRACAVGAVVDVIRDQSKVGNLKTIIFVDEGLSQNHKFLETVVTGLRKVTKDKTLKKIEATIEQVIEDQKRDPESAEPKKKQTKDKQTEDEQTKDEQTEDKQPEDKQTEDKQTEDEQTKDEQTEDKQPEDKQTEDETADKTDKGKQLKDPKERVFVALLSLENMVQRMKGKQPEFETYVSRYGQARELIDLGTEVLQEMKVAIENAGLEQEHNLFVVMHSLENALEILTGKQPEFGAFVEKWNEYNDSIDSGTKVLQEVVVAMDKAGLAFPDKNNKRKRDEDDQEENKKGKK